MTWVYSRWLRPDVHHPLELEQFQILSMVREIQMSKNELFMVSVKIGRIAGRSSFTTAICNLSFPGALFEGNDCTILLILKEVAAQN